jgi:hypothetical protein
VTPRRTIAVAVLTFAAVVASLFAAAVIVGLLVARCLCLGEPGNSTFGHALRHLLSAVLTVAVALGIRRLRRAWPAPAPDLLSPVRAFGEKQYQLLAFAQWLVLAAAAGQFVESAGAITYSATVHDAGLILAFGAWGILLFVCLHMLGVGVRGALRPTAHSS